MKNIFAFMLAGIIIITVLSGCKSSAESEESYKNPNDMTWTVDTLQYEDYIQTNMANILAFSTQDIFIYGHSHPYGQVYHFDGTSWSVFNIAQYINGASIKKMIAFSRSSFYGAAENSEYKSQVFTGDGSSWALISPFQSKGGMLTVTGSSKRNIYTAGRNGDVLYFNGSDWSYNNIKIVPETGGEYLINASAIYNDTVHFLGTMSGLTKNVYYHIKGKYNNWQIVDSMTLINSSTELKWGNNDLYVSSANKLYSCGYHGVWEYTGSGWKNIFECTYSINGMFVLNENYIIACGELGRLYFYDGSEWITLTNFQIGYEDILYQVAWGDGKELFVIGYTYADWPMRTIVFHGK